MDLQNLLYERCVITLVDLASMYQTKYDSVLCTKNLTAKTKYVTAKPKTSRQKQNTSRQNQKPHGKNKIPHGKTKNLTAKPNTSQQKQNSFSFAVGFCFFSQYLVLP